jgi:hypothetical protein
VDASELLTHLTASGFRDIAGARLSARLPISNALLNRVIADALRGTSSPVRSVDVRPRTGQRFEVVVTTSLALLPPLTVQVAVDRQPRFPESPFLFLRWSFHGRVGAIASRFVGALESKLPPGIALDGDRVGIDTATMVRQAGLCDAFDWLPYVTGLELHTLDDQTVIEINLVVP